MIKMISDGMPEVLRKGVGLLVPYIIDCEYDVKDCNNNSINRYTFYYCIVDDNGQDLSNASIVNGLIDATKYTQDNL